MKIVGFYNNKNQYLVVICAKEVSLYSISDTLPLTNTQATYLTYHPLSRHRMYLIFYPPPPSTLPSHHTDC